MSEVLVIQPPLLLISARIPFTNGAGWPHLLNRAESVLRDTSNGFYRRNELWVVGHNFGARFRSLIRSV